MNQYQIENAIHKIDGYHIPRPNESREASFLRAKAETVSQLKRDVEDVEAVTMQQFDYQMKQ